MNAARAAALLSLAAFSLVLLTGCQTCGPKCCETCPVETVVVTVEKRVMVPAPLIEREDPPPVLSGCAEGEDPTGPCWSKDEAEADPDGWAEALLADLGAWVNSWFRADGKIEANNSTRPDP